MNLSIYGVTELYEYVTIRPWNYETIKLWSYEVLENLRTTKL